MKTFTIILASILSLFVSLPLISADKSDIMINDIIDPPEAAALSIILESITSLKALQSHKKSSFQNIVTLINHKLVPNIDITTAANFALKKHWSKLNVSQKMVFKKYLLKSLINDYANIISASNDNLENVSIFADKNIKRKGNKAIVSLNVIISDDIDPISLSVRMVRKDKWKIYDLVISGVSLMKNYRANFDNQIKRRGIEALVDRLSKKI